MTSLHRRGFLAGTAGAAAALATGPALAREWGNPASVSYPDPDIEVIDPRFGKYVVGNTSIRRLWTGGFWAEGPAWFGEGRYLIFSDIPNNRLMRYDALHGRIDVYREPSHYTNGNTTDREGRLLSCEQGMRRVTRTEHDGSLTVLIDSYDGKALNAPNDVVVKSDGSIWFTDPGYGRQNDYEGHKAAFELPTNVYRLDPDSGKATVVAGDFVRPNGLCFSPDESRLYVCDTGITQGKENPSHIRVFEVDGDKLKNGKVFHDFAPAFADGIRCDTDGNVWAGTGWGGAKTNGVTVFTPEGDLIGQIHLPEICANVSFGGPAKNLLFMTASTSLYAVYVNATGAQKP